MNDELAQTQPKSSRAGPDLIGALRGIIGFVALVLAVLGATLIPLFAAIGQGWGAAGDGYQRFLLGSALLVTALLLGSLFLFSGWSATDLFRSRASWIIGVVFGLAITWGAFGIDSTRPLREMPEARLGMPRALEISSGTRPAEGGLNRVARAELWRAFETSSARTDVEVFFTRTLRERGWQSAGNWETSEHQYLEWERDGYLFQLRLSDPDISWPGSFLYSIFGPEQ
jgi:hypothetical protein